MIATKALQALSIGRSGILTVCLDLHDELGLMRANNHRGMGRNVIETHVATPAMREGGSARVYNGQRGKISEHTTDVSNQLGFGAWCLKWHTHNGDLRMK